MDWNQKSIKMEIVSYKTKNKCSTIRERLKEEILTLTDTQAEYVLRRLQCLLHEKN